MINRDTEIKFNHLTIEDGLSQSSVNCIIQDSDGFMWFGTQDGLNKYDGNKFTVFRNDKENPQSICDNFIYSLCEDSSKNLWIGTGTGLCRYDSDNENFCFYDTGYDKKPVLTQNQVRSVIEDSNRDLWIGTYGGGLRKFDMENSRFHHYKNSDDDPVAEKITVLFEDSKKNFYAGTRGRGLYLFDRESKKFFRHNGFEDTEKEIINTIAEDYEGNIWFGTSNGIYASVSNGKELIRYSHEPGSAMSLSNNIVLKVFEDSLKNLWFATGDGGLNLFDREKNNFINFRNDSNNEFSLSNNSIMSMYEDKSGIIWLGTLGGACMFNRQIKKIYHFYSDKRKSNSLCSNTVYCFYEDNSNRLWIGTWDNGLNRFDLTENQFTHYRHKETDSTSLSDNIVTSIISDSSGKLWIGTSGGGLNKLDPDTGKFYRFRKNSGDANSLSHDTIFSMAIDGEDVIWIGTGGGGLNKFDTAAGKFTKYLYDENDSNSISSNRVRTIFIDSKKNIWIGTDNGGLNKFDKSSGKFFRFKNNADDLKSIGDNDVLDIMEDKSGNLWIGTMRGGLNKLDTGDETFTRYTEKDGLPNMTVNGILEDNSGNIWVSTNKGLSKFIQSEKVFKNYDMRDGFQSNEFNQGARLKLKSGELVFGGIKGFNIFNPEDIKDNPYTPQIVFTNFQIFNKDISVSEKNPALKKSIAKAEEIELSYYDSVFSFEFASLDFTIPDKNLFAYKMEGFDKGWVYPGSRRYVTYTNLNPGEYTFRVKGSNNDGVWNEEGKSIRIKISPPFWKTWWFKSIGALAVAGLSGSIYQSKLNKVKKEKKAQEEFSKRLIEVQENDRKRIAAELHDSIGHDLLITKNKLMLSAKQTADKESLISNINEASEIISGTLKEVRQISYTLHPYQIERLGFAKAVLSIFERMNKSSGIHFISNIDKIDGIFPPDVEINLYRLIQECASNILKHSKASEVILNVTKSETGISILISDNGAGFNIEKIKANSDKHGLGLKGMSERVKLFGGKIEIKSSTGKGTTAIISVPFAGQK